MLTDEKKLRKHAIYKKTTYVWNKEKLDIFLILNLVDTLLVRVYLHVLFACTSFIYKKLVYVNNKLFYILFISTHFDIITVHLNLNLLFKHIKNLHDEKHYSWGYPDYLLKS